MRIEDAPASAIVMQLPPSRCTADSNDRRVRVDGSKNAIATILSSRGCITFFPSAYGTILRADARISSISSRERSRMEITSRPWSDIRCVKGTYGLRHSPGRTVRSPCLPGRNP